MAKRKSFAAHIFAPVTITWDQFLNLLWPFGHNTQSKRQRYALIISRVQFISAIFGILVPVWIIVDWYVIPDQWQQLAGYRLIFGAIFIGISLPRNIPATPAMTILMLVALLAIAPAMYLATLPILEQMPTHGIQGIARTLYTFLPYTVVGGLSIFPLTLLETVLYSLPVFGFTAYGTWQLDTGNWEVMLSSLWLLFLIMGISCFSGMSQLQYMIALVNRASLDPLTGAFTRRTGTETIDLQYRIASMHKTPMAIAFFDLDNFKSVNDNFGHEEGDNALVRMAEALRSALRRGDSLIRWGGEEFILLLSNADHDGARLVVDRILKNGFGNRPDGKPLTASIGVSELLADSTLDWPEMVDLADSRMYEAKQSGKNRAIFPGNETMVGPEAD
ncbi:MAG: GGDEF domain-containing protein [Rhodospirillales bacterium]|nr:GGDEF domain-containing protein [Rhodospirillales bacterium]